MPETSVETISKNFFKSCVGQIMSHTIMAFIEKAKEEYKVNLQISIKPQRALSFGYFAVNYPKWIKTQKDELPCRYNLYVKIKINAQASKEAARIAISHELYHIYEELEYFKEKGFPPSMALDYETRRREEEIYQHWLETKDRDSKGCFERYQSECLATSFAKEYIKYLFAFTNDKDFREKYHHIGDDTSIKPLISYSLNDYLSILKNSAVSTDFPYNVEPSFEEIEQLIKRVSDKVCKEHS